MRIAQIPPLYESIPPKLYGGTERVVAHLCDALVELGHEVTLFGPADAHTRAELVAVRDQAIRLDSASLTSDVAAHLAMLHAVRERADDFDVLHFHTELLQFPMFGALANRTLTTLHGRLDIKDLGPIYRLWPNFPLASISDRQRRPLPEAHWHGTVAHGFPPGLYGFSPHAQGGYLAFLGRMSPEKRPDRAIAIARRAGLPLRMAAKVDAADRAYFQREVEPLLGTPGVEFVGEIGDADKARFLGDAVALLFPIDWPEPFGLVMIEAMACGTPVIGWRCGAVPEVLEDGLTGRIVDSEDEAVAAVAEVARYDRHAVRRRFEERFTAAAMARAYVELYRSLPGVATAPLQVADQHRPTLVAGGAWRRGHA